MTDQAQSRLRVVTREIEWEAVMSEPRKIQTEHGEMVLRKFLTPVYPCSTLQPFGEWIITTTTFPADLIADGEEENRS